MKKRAMVLFLVYSTIFLVNSVSGSIRVRDLCDLEGYTILDCTSVSFRSIEDSIRIPRLDEPIRLENGMIIIFSGIGPIALKGGEDAVVCGTGMTYQDKEMVFYKIIIEDSVYEAIRVS